MATVAVTTGDGACSLHALWGTVIPTSQGNEYYCENPRDKLCYAMPAEVSETVCFFLHFSLFLQNKTFLQTLTPKPLVSGSPRAA